MAFHQLKLHFLNTSRDVWAQMLIAVPNLPSPSEWEWVQTNNGGWEVKWTALPEASKACRELISKDRLQESMQMC